MEAFVTNVNYRGALCAPINLHALETVFPNSRLCTHPFQLVITDERGKLLFFSSGKYRVMGFKQEDDIEATSLVFKYTSLIDKDYFPSLTLQSITMKAKFNSKVDLCKLSSLIKSNLELELFPVLTITKYKPVMVNVFATGAIIMCGIKDQAFSNFILNDINELLHLCTIRG